MKRFLAASIALSLLAPAAASAAETTVDPNASGCTAGGKCKTINEAIDVSANGDTVRVLPGVYAENVDVNKDLTIDGEPGAAISGPGSGATLTLSTGGSEVLDLVLFKLGSDPVVSVTGAGEKRMQRSTVIGGSDGVVLTTGASAGSLVMDSSVVTGASGPAFRVTTPALVGLGAASLTLNHVTATKNGSGVTLVSNTGGITFASNASILHGASTSADNNPLSGPVTATYTNSDATAMTGAATSSETATPDDQLFGEGLFLKASSPAIDKGGAITAGESNTDIQGDARTIGGATDIGADEYINHKPVAKLTLSAPQVKTDEVVFALTSAADIDGKADIASYSVDWGDGKVDTALNPPHFYAKAGTYTVTFTATDRAGAISDPVTASVTVTDGSPPQVQITSPKEGASVKLAGKVKNALAVKGVHADNDAVSKVEVAITRRAGGCAQYDGKAFVAAKCKQFKFFPATLTGFRFRFDSAKLKFTKGAYEVRARATDNTGTRSVGFTKDAKTLVKFKIS